MSEGFEGKNIVRLDAFRKKPEAVVPQAMETSAAPLLQPEEHITLEEAVVIARDVVTKYADKQELFNTYLKEHEKEPSLRSIEVFNIMLEQKKEMLAQWSTQELTDYLQYYKKGPDDTFKMHLFAVAEELLKRFPENVQ